MDIYIKGTKDKGRGVFANRDFKKGEIIEACPIIIIPKKDLEIIDKTILSHYYFLWGKNDGALVLGYGSMFNHSYNANATFKPDFERELMIFTCVKDIKKGEEIMTNYNGEPNDETPYEL